MMGLLDDCDTLFGTKNLYEVLNLSSSATENEIKKAYRKLSLKYHPDRHTSSSHSKDQLTRFFQVLSKVHFILTDKDKRSFYDTTGLIDKEDCLDSEADWDDYFRALFPKVTRKDIDSFIEKYIGSDDEIADVKKYYLQFEGDMDKMSECIISFDEDRTREIIDQLIQDEEVPAYDSFTKEPAAKRKRRLKRMQKEAKEAAKVNDISNGEPFDSLVNAIQSKSKGNFDSMIASLEAKYSQPPRKKAKKTK